MSQAQQQSNINDIVSGKRLTQKDTIFKILSDGLPMTFEQIQKATGFKQATIVGRLSELATDGLVVENPISNLSYYSPVYVDELRDIIKKRKSEERTKRVLKALINDNDAMDVLIKHCFIEAYRSYISGREDGEIKEDIIELIKKYLE